ncbi:MAG: glycosyltransferase [Gammaproteobacteria bacterium]|nr:glycosyltransferase [Gammaproteobacteria bacterium]
MRILVLTSTFPRWVNDKEPEFVLDLCRYLNSNSIEIDVLAPHSHGAAKYEAMDNISVYRYQYYFNQYQSLAYAGGIMANLKSNPFRYFQLPFFILFQTIALMSRLGKVEYDLIHAHWLIPQGFIAAIVKTISRNKNIQIICTSHGGDLYALDNSVFRILKRWTINQCREFCVVSQAMERKAASLGIIGDQIHVMPMGVDFDKLFRPVPGIQRKQRQIIFVGRLVEKKGVDILINSFAEVSRTLPGCNLQIIGDGPKRPELEKLMKELGLEENVLFSGSVNHHALPKYYSSASLAIVPSIVAASGDQEGLGLVSLEAMGCGCAVIASSLEAIGDVIDNDTGVLVNPGDSSELSRAIIDLLNDPQKRMKLAQQGQEKARQLFSWEVSGGRYLELIRATNRGMKSDLLG